MKIKIELENGETIQEADDFLEKAVKAKSEVNHHERYADRLLNEFHDLLIQRHEDMLNALLERIAREVTYHASR